MGVIVQFKTGKVVRYATATEFEAHRGNYWVLVRRVTTARVKDRFASSGYREQSRSKTLALIPRAEVLRVELSGSGQPAPEGKRVKR